jgi:pimeloyl-ACP methyl ester carboxylesterase
MPPTEPTGLQTIRRRNEWLATKFEGRRIRLFVRRWIPSEPNGCVVFCVHPMTTTGGHFTFLARYLAHRGYTVVSPDLAGHGRSTYLRQPDAYGAGLVTRTLSGITAHYSGHGRDRVFIGSSWGAANLCAFLATSRLRAAAVIINDFALERTDVSRAAAQYFHAGVAGLTRRFDAIADAVEYLKRRDEDVLGQRDTDEVSPKALERHYTSRLMKVNGKYALAFDPCVLVGLRRAEAPGAPYPDFYRTISKIDSTNILLLFGEHSQYRASKVRDRLLADRTNVTALDVEGAGHAPRLLSDRQARLVYEFIEKARVRRE